MRLLRRSSPRRRVRSFRDTLNKRKRSRKKTRGRGRGRGRGRTPRRTRRTRRTRRKKSKGKMDPVPLPVIDDDDDIIRTFEGLTEQLNRMEPEPEPEPEPESESVFDDDVHNAIASPTLECPVCQVDSVNPHLVKYFYDCQHLFCISCNKSRIEMLPENVLDLIKGDYKMLLESNDIEDAETKATDHVEKYRHYPYRYWFDRAENVSRLHADVNDQQFRIQYEHAAKKVRDVCPLCRSRPLTPIEFLEKNDYFGKIVYEGYTGTLKHVAVSHTTPHQGGSGGPGRKVYGIKLSVKNDTPGGAWAGWESTDARIIKDYIMDGRILKASD